MAHSLKTCEFCSLEFACYAYQKEARRYCCRKCKHEAQRKPNGATEEEFWSHVAKGSCCWLWTGSVSRYGYGRFWHTPTHKHLAAHRKAFELSNRVVLTRDVEVCHTCDNPRCVNPDHLFLGSHKDNMRDAALKGRIKPSFIKGENVWKAIFSPTDIKAIRAAHSSGLVTYAEIAAKYRTDASTICKIIKRRTWKHVGQG